MMLEQLPIFASLPEEHLARVEAISRQIFAEKGSILFSPGDATQGFYGVLDGAVRVFRVSPKGKEISLELVGTGSIVAGASLFSDIYHCYAEALKDSTVCLVRKEPFFEWRLPRTFILTSSVLLQRIAPVLPPRREL
jgi:CRP/FNR family transcriptional regulator